LKELVLY